MTERHLELRIRDIVDKGDFTPACGLFDGKPLMNIPMDGYDNMCISDKQCPVKLIYDDKDRCIYHIVIKHMADGI